MKPAFVRRVDREDIRLAVFWRDSAAAGGCTDILSGRRADAATCREYMRHHARAWAIRQRPAIDALPSYLESAADAA
jgi:hypothetical protein